MFFFIILLASTFRNYKITCKNILIYQFLLNLDIYNRNGMYVIKAELIKMGGFR